MQSLCYSALNAHDALDALCPMQYHYGPMDGQMDGQSQQITNRIILILCLIVSFNLSLRPPQLNVVKSSLFASFHCLIAHHSMLTFVIPLCLRSLFFCVDRISLHRLGPPSLPSAPLVVIRRCPNAIIRPPTALKSAA